MNNHKANLIRGLYGIADSGFRPEMAIERKVLAFLDGGASVVQVRMKEASARTLWESSIRAVAAARGRALVIVNDRPDVAMASGADGVHVGEHDLPVSEARRVVGPHFLVGATVRTIEEALLAVEQGADYLGFGPVFATSTKSIAVAPRGLELLAEVAKISRVPVVAIGGINFERTPGVIESGAAAVAVVSEVLGAADPVSRARQLTEAFGL